MARLTKNQKLFLCQKIAERRTYSQIEICFKDEFGFPITRNQIHYFKERTPDTWGVVIQEMREGYDRAVSDLAMASKRNRLEMLQESYDTAKKATVEIFRRNDEEEKEVIKTNPAAMVAAVRQAHEEMEGKSVRHKHSGKVKGGEKVFIISHVPPPDPLPDDIEEDETGD